MLLASAGSFAAPNSSRMTARMIRKCHPVRPCNMSSPSGSSFQCSPRTAARPPVPAIVEAPQRYCARPASAHAAAARRADSRLEDLDGARRGARRGAEAVLVGDAHRRDRDAARRLDRRAVEVVAEQRRDRLREADAGDDVAAAGLEPPGHRVLAVRRSAMSVSSRSLTRSRWNVRIASRRWHHPCRYHWPVAMSTFTGSTVRVVGAASGAL